MIDATHKTILDFVKGNPMDGLTEGRIVHFVMPNGVHRPAMVVHVWDKRSGYVNLQVFTDGMNDNIMNTVENDFSSGLYWATSIYPDETEKKPGSWHWIEKA